ITTWARSRAVLAKQRSEEAERQRDDDIARIELFRQRNMERLTEISEAIWKKNSPADIVLHKHNAEVKESLKLSTQEGTDENSVRETISLQRLVPPKNSSSFVRIFVHLGISDFMTFEVSLYAVVAQPSISGALKQLMCSVEEALSVRRDEERSNAVRNADDTTRNGRGTGMTPNARNGSGVEVRDVRLLTESYNEGDEY
uniref:Uncharacterized protein n=1 Tax=Parascaris equorum TaxID=6256 RepID=A0A914S3K8_PAREQ